MQNFKFAVIDLCRCNSHLHMYLISRYTINNNNYYYNQEKKKYKIFFFVY